MLFLQMKVEDEKLESILCIQYFYHYFVAGRRKSNCVKEVERIKQRREERRAHQQAVRELQDTEFDTTDPNWEFLSMIR